MRPSGPRPKGWPEKGHLPCRTVSRDLRPSSITVAIFPQSHDGSLLGPPNLASHSALTKFHANKPFLSLPGRFLSKEDYPPVGIAFISK